MVTCFIHAMSHSNYKSHVESLTLSNKDQWHKRIKNIVSSASKAIRIMRKLKFTFHGVALNRIYLSYMLPVLEYSAVVWDNCAIQDSDMLEKLQNEAARFVTGLTRPVCLVNLYRECGLVTLNTRRKPLPPPPPPPQKKKKKNKTKKKKLASMYKAVNDMTPDYISDLIPHFVRETTDYPLRNNNILAVPFTTTKI